ncbi:hypothetical protein MQ4_35 [Serratia phage MQ-4]|nr:hypothetical protein MQ4_35 [Serratia phage MQ-4]
MSDDLERASDLENAQREAALEHHRNRPAAPKAVGRGYCLNCFEDFEGDNTRLYCDGKCSQQHAVKLSRK